MIIYGFYRANELVYIGQTTMPLIKRLQSHFSNAKVGRNLCMLIVRALRKYGKESFTWEILKECSTKEELNLVECRLIKKHNPRYNIATGGAYGFGHSKETREKISNIQKKRIMCIDDQICFESVLDAEKFYNAGKGTIGRVAAGKRRSYKGKKFKFIN